MTEAIDPYLVDVDDDVLTDLHERLVRTRLPDQIDGTGWEFGFPVAELRDLVEYWRDGYDWRVHEARLNEFPQFRTTVDGQNLHFIHARSPHEDAVPLLLMHGWPGSIVEFLDVVEPLRDPDSHGGDTADTYHVIAPSLPGYGFSGPTTEPGWDPARIARAFATLMERLGYDRYVAQGGDWGSQVATRIALADPQHCAAIHLNMVVTRPPRDADITLTDEEQGELAGMVAFQREETGYANEQGTKPQTLGVGLNDSPAGLLAWIGEKFRGWSDCDGRLENAFTKDQLLTNAMVYWVTGTITSSMRLYREMMHSEEPRPGFVEVPTGVARYPKEVFRPPRAWVEHAYNVVAWTELPRGGHFAAMEQPDLFVSDLRAFRATTRS